MRPCRPTSIRMLNATVIILWLGCGCATNRAVNHDHRSGTLVRYPSFPAARPERSADLVTRGKRTQVAQEAAKWVGQPSVKTNLRDDASGLVRAIYRGTGLDPDAGGRKDLTGVERLYQFARNRGVLYRGGTPRVGDLAFFHDTYDRNGDGVRNDPLTHVAVVERVEPDGTVVLVHRVEQGIVRQRMNLRHPQARRDPESGKVWNHLLRASAKREKARTTAELFAGFATLYVDPPEGTALASR